MKKTIVSMLCVLLVLAMMPIAAFAGEPLPFYTQYSSSATVGKQFNQSFSVKRPAGWTDFSIELDEEKTNAMEFGFDFIITAGGVMLFGEPTKPGVATIEVILKSADPKVEDERETFSVIVYTTAVDAKEEMTATVGERVSEILKFEDYRIFMLDGRTLTVQKNNFKEFGLTLTVDNEGLTIAGKPTKAGTAEALVEFAYGKVTCTFDLKMVISEKKPEPTPTPVPTPAPVFTFRFTDVKTTDWFYGDVFTAAKMGLIDGKTTTQFAPNDNMTYAEAIKLAACMSQYKADGKVTLKNGTVNWYDTYVEYAKAHGIPTDFADMNAKITREDFVHVFFHALPADSYKSINQIGAIPDVSVDAPLYSEIMTFYSAGILTGSDAKGTFNPTSSIKRSEVAAILSRMMDASTRKSFTIQ